MVHFHHIRIIEHVSNIVEGIFLLLGGAFKTILDENESISAFQHEWRNYLRPVASS